MNKKDVYNPQALQQQYEHCQDLHRQLIHAQQQWREAEQLWQDLSAYYQSAQWLEDYDNAPELQCREGEYSILAQDTLWNALEERRQLAIDWMKLGLKAIEQ